MATETRDARLEDLLAQAGWLTKLARQLVRDGDGADDVAQETWLAALRSPPDPARPPRPWLAHVLRNFVRQRARSEGRRHRHEEAAFASRDQSVEAADRLYERMDLQRAIAERVMTLDEPHRRIVLLRYYEGRSCAEIARMVGVPASTVRWQLGQGLERLRSALDQRPGGRNAWRAALAPMTQASWAALWAGGAVMSKGTVSIAGFVVLALVLGSGVTAWRRSRTDADSRSSPALHGPDPAAASEESSATSRMAGIDGVPRPPRPGGPPPRFVESAPRHPDVAPPTTTGTLSKDELRTAIHAAVPAVKRWFEELLAAAP